LRNINSTVSELAVSKARAEVYAMHRTAPTTATRRTQPDDLRVVQTAPIETHGENGKSQKTPGLATASTFATNPGRTVPSVVSTIRAPLVTSTPQRRLPPSVRL
jgi:hypothetical protein